MRKKIKPDDKETLLLIQYITIELSFRWKGNGSNCFDIISCGTRFSVTKVEDNILYER